MGRRSFHLPNRKGHNLESLMEPQLPVEIEGKSQAPSIDRAVIGKAEATKSQAWIEQIKEATRGFLNLSKSDLINFLIREHKDELSAKEIVQIRLLNYDPLKHINWISHELRKALAKSDFEMVAVLQSELKQIELAPTRTLMNAPENIEVPKKAGPVMKSRKIGNAVTSIEPVAHLDTNIFASE